jgi:hypothetical protein
MGDYDDGRDPTDQQRSWLVSKIRTDIAMIGTTSKLNAQVIIGNLQNMHAKSLLPTGVRGRMELEYQDWARLQSDRVLPCHSRQGTTHGQT